VRHHYCVRSLKVEDVDLVIDYFQGLTAIEAQNMGLKKANLPEPNAWRMAMISGIIEPPSKPHSGMLIWELDGLAIGMNTLKDMTPKDTGFMHLHMWAKDLRGQGHGRQFFCLAALKFFETFELKHIYCEPSSLNPAPNTMLSSIGFPLVRTYVGQSSAIADVCQLNRYAVEPEICRAFLARSAEN